MKNVANEWTIDSEKVRRATREKNDLRLKISKLEAHSRRLCLNLRDLQKNRQDIRCKTLALAEELRFAPIRRLTDDENETVSLGGDIRVLLCAKKRARRDSGLGSAEEQTKSSSECSCRVARENRPSHRCLCQKCLLLLLRESEFHSVSSTNVCRDVDSAGRQKIDRAASRYKICECRDQDCSNDACEDGSECVAAAEIRESPSEDSSSISSAATESNFFQRSRDSVAAKRRRDRIVAKREARLENFDESSRRAKMENTSAPDKTLKMDLLAGLSVLSIIILSRIFQCPALFSASGDAKRFLARVLDTLERSIAESLRLARETSKFFNRDSFLVGENPAGRLGSIPSALTLVGAVFGSISFANGLLRSPAKALLLRLGERSRRFEASPWLTKSYKSAKRFLKRFTFFALSQYHFFSHFSYLALGFIAAKLSPVIAYQWTLVRSDPPECDSPTGIELW